MDLSPHTRLSRDFYGMGQFGGNGGEGRWDEWDDFSVALWIRVRGYIRVEW